MVEYIGPGECLAGRNLYERKVEYLRLLFRLTGHRKSRDRVAPIMVARTIDCSFGDSTTPMGRSRKLEALRSKRSRSHPQLPDAMTGFMELPR
jgi:hypothetical protein